MRNCAQPVPKSLAAGSSLNGLAGGARYVDFRPGLIVEPEPIERTVHSVFARHGPLIIVNCANEARRCLIHPASEWLCDRSGLLKGDSRNRSPRVEIDEPTSPRGSELEHRVAAEHLDAKI